MTIRCKCLWARSGLGAAVVEPRPDCEVHGINGPMPMFMQAELAQIGKQAGVLKAKHDIYEKVGQGDRAVGKAEVGGRMYGNYQNDQHLDRLTAREADRIGRALQIGEEQEQEKGDDRHVFTSGAMSSGKKPGYAEIFQRLTMLLLERTTAQRRYGDNKYGVNNWMKGARDKQFILDRINHGIEHLLVLARQVETDDSGCWEPGVDDAAAVACCAMFVMQWQKEMSEHERKMDTMKATEERDPRVGGGPSLRPGSQGIADCGNDYSEPYGHGV